MSEQPIPDYAALPLPPNILYFNGPIDQPDVEYGAYTTSREYNNQRTVPEVKQGSQPPISPQEWEFCRQNGISVGDMPLQAA